MGGSLNWTCIYMLVKPHEQKLSNIACTELAAVGQR